MLPTNRSSSSSNSVVEATLLIPAGVQNRLDDILRDWQWLLRSRNPQKHPSDTQHTLLDSHLKYTPQSCHVTSRHVTSSHAEPCCAVRAYR